MVDQLALFQDPVHVPRLHRMPEWIRNQIRKNIIAARGFSPCIDGPGEATWIVVQTSMPHEVTFVKNGGEEPETGADTVCVACGISVPDDILALSGDEQFVAVARFGIQQHNDENVEKLTEMATRAVSKYNEIGD